MLCAPRDLMAATVVGNTALFAGGCCPYTDVVDIYEGFPDCNGNGIPDSIDIATGTSKDCNSNGIPDECEASASTAQPS